MGDPARAEHAFERGGGGPAGLLLGGLLMGGLLLGGLLLGGCAHHGPAPVHTVPSAAPEQPWQPPAGEAAPRQHALASLDDDWMLPAAGAPLDLAGAVDLALHNSPQTRQAWAAARAAAADVGTERAGAFPQLSLGGQAELQHSQFSPTLTIDRKDVGLSASLSWLLFDSGGQRARVAQGRQALLAASWSHDAAIQDLVLQVERAWYGYLDARAQADAAQATADEAEQNLAAAQARLDAGLGTREDVLQARTARSQAQLGLLSAQGQVRVLRGSLATVLGLPPTTALDTGELPAVPDVGPQTAAVEDLLIAAVDQRPDLAAAAYDLAQADSRLRQARAAGLPSVSLFGSDSPTWYLSLGTGGSPSTWSFGNNYTAGLSVSTPLFEGFKIRSQVAAARARVDLAQGQLQALHQQVALQVWTSFQDVQTAAARVHAAGDLLASATESQQVAQARYEQGVGSILELLTAQSALAAARAQEARARADWLLALAQLAHDTGAADLGPPDRGAAAPGPDAARGETP